MHTVLALNNDQMGYGDADLGTRILKTFLQKSRALPGLQSIVFYNAGVRLLVAGSPVLGELDMLHENGVDLLPCVTCLEHYGLECEVVPPSTMDQILAELGAADKVITL
jgi:hypothetical protein